MLKLKNIEPDKLNKIRFGLFLTTYLFFCIGYSIDMILELPSYIDMGIIYVTLGLFIILVILLLFKKDTIDLRFKRFFSYLLVITGLLALVIVFTDTFLYFNLSRGLYWSIVDIIYATLICEIIVLYIIFVHKVEIIIPGLIIVILLGLVLNGIGLEDEAGAVLIYAFILLTISMLYVSFRSIGEFRDYKLISRLLFFMGLVLTFCSISLVVKFSMWEAAHTSAIDFLGAIVFLTACLTLFAAMPFTNFIEWTRKQKRFFYRIFLIPMFFFLVLFSMKFLMPGTYQKLFFKGYSEKEKVFFGMKKYELKEPEEKEIVQD